MKITNIECTVVSIPMINPIRYSQGVVEGTTRTIVKVYTDEDYLLIGEKENYFSTRGEFTTIGKSLDKTQLKEFITNVEFEKNLVLNKIIVDKSIVLDNIYYDLTEHKMVIMAL